MRMIIFLILSAVLVFGAYWVITSQLIEHQVAKQLDENPHVSGKPRNVTGFPLRFSLRIEDPSWRSVEDHVSWSASELTLQAASHQPNRLTADFPQVQTLGLGAVETTLTTDRMQAMLTAGLDRNLRAAALEIDTGRLTPALGIAGLAGAQFSLQHLDNTRYALRADVEGLRFGSDLVEALDPAGQLAAPMIEDLHLDARAEFAAALPLDAPWPDLMALEVAEVRLDWGALQLGAKGEIARGDSGLFNGELTLQIADWQPLLALLQSHGILPPDAAMMAAMFFASQSEPGTQRLSLPLQLRESRLFLGPFPLIELPAF